MLIAHLLTGMHSQITKETRKQLVIWLRTLSHINLGIWLLDKNPATQTVAKIVGFNGWSHIPCLFPLNMVWNIGVEWFRAIPMLAQ